MTLTRTSAKGYFETNDKPTQAQFAELFEGIVFQQGTSAQFVQSNVSAQGNWDFKKDVTVSGALTISASSQANFSGNVIVSGVPTFTVGLEKCINSTWDTSTIGVQTVTGTGFTPKSVQIMMNIDNTEIISDGWTDGTTSACRFWEANANTQQSSTSVIVAARTQTGVTESQAIFTSFTSNGMTMTWTKTGAPSGTANLFFKFSR